MERETISDKIVELLEEFNERDLVFEEKRKYVSMSKDARSFERLAAHSLRQAVEYLDLANEAEKRHREDD